jgi:uncharacterized protein with GYD domain
MTTYIALFNLTDAGIKAAKDSPRRLDAAKKLLADMGGEMKQFYMVMGEFDFVGICEARRAEPRCGAGLFMRLFVNRVNDRRSACLMMMLAPASRWRKLGCEERASSSTTCRCWSAA